MLKERERGGGREGERKREGKKERERERVKLTHIIRRQSDQHWNCFKGNTRKTEKRGGALNYGHS